MRRYSVIVLVGLCVGLLISCVTQKEKYLEFEQNIIKMTFSPEGVTQTQDKGKLSERMEHYNVPGVNLAVVENNEIEWEKGYGVLDASKSNQMGNNAMFQVGSVSKFVTAMIVMHYVEKDILDLDEDINVYLRSWKMPENEFGVNITLRQLLTHQSGLPGTNFSYEGDISPSLPQILSAEKPALNKPAYPTFKPGEKWSYSNIGYVVIQLILEDIIGKSMNEIAEEVLFKPLKMNFSTFNYPLPKSWQTMEAMPHTTEGESRPAVQGFVPAVAQGGLLSTPRDMALLTIELMKAYKGESNKIFSQTTAKQMLTAEVDIPIQAYGIPFKMGLGLFLDHSGGKLSFLHPGQSYPGSAFLIIGFPESGQAATMGLNGNIGDQLELEIVATLSEMYNWSGGQFFK